MFNAMCQRGFLSVIGEAQNGFSTLPHTRRYCFESLQSTETRFPGALTSFSPLSAGTRLPQCTIALVLLSTAAVHHQLRTSAPAATPPFGITPREQSSSDESLKATTYKQFTSFVKQFERAHNDSITMPLTAISAGVTTHGSSTKKWGHAPPL